METKQAETAAEKSGMAARLEQLGFKKAAARVKELRVQQRKLALAYEHFRVVTEEDVQRFQVRLREDSHDWDGVGGYHRLDFVDASVYEGTPPADVLDKAEEAAKLNCFDKTEVAFIAKVRDPILFGRVNGCSDRFYIAQWDDDVSIDDILAPNQG